MSFSFFPFLFKVNYFSIFHSFLLFFNFRSHVHDSKELKSHDFDHNSRKSSGDSRKQKEEKRKRKRKRKKKKNKKKPREQSNPPTPAAMAPIVIVVVVVVVMEQQWQGGEGISWRGAMSSQLKYSLN